MSRIPVALLISGGGSNMARLVDDMAAPDHPGRPVLVLSNRPEAGGLAKAQAAGVETAVLDHRAYASRADYDAALAARVAQSGAEVVCLAGFLRVLTGAFLGPFAGRVLNIHPSLLPLYPGLHTHQRALDAGDREAGCTVHLVTEELDAGPILGQSRVPVLSGDTAETLAARVLVAEHRLYPAVLRRFLAGERAPLLV